MNEKTIYIVIIAVLGIGLVFLLREVFKKRNNNSSALIDSVDRLLHGQSPRANNTPRRSAANNTVQSGNATRTGTNSSRNGTTSTVRVNRPALVPASREGITETGPMVYFANDRHGRRDKEYRFNYKKVGNSWRAYILRTPSFEGRDTSLGATHRHFEGSAYYICWDRPIDNLKDMQTVSRVWADSIQEYIATGRFANR